MNVHVIKDSSFPVEQYEQVMKLLQATPGLISFRKQDKHVAVIDPEIVAVNVEGDLLVNADGSLVKQENLVQVYPWDYFFHQCEVYREDCQIPAEDFIIVLTPKSNEYWYLAAFDDEARNVLVKTSEWEAYLECDPVYPTAYTVMSQVLSKLYFGDMDRRTNEGHKPAIGCITDICIEKHEMIFKFRTADICMGCLKSMLDVGIPQEYFLQALSLFEKVRHEMLFKQRHKFIVEQRSIRITRTKVGGQGITIQFPEIKKEINLNPKESALYLFYLTAPKGVPYAQLHYEKHRSRLLSLYTEFCEGDVRGNGSTMESVINTLVNNAVNRASDLSRMRDKFTDVLGEEVAKQYYINGLDGDGDRQKGIRLKRDMVSYDDDIITQVLGGTMPGEV